MSDEVLVAAVEAALKQTGKLVEAQAQLATQAGRAKRSTSCAGTDIAAAATVRRLAEPRLETLLRAGAALGEAPDWAEFSEAKEQVLEHLKRKGSFRNEVSFEQPEILKLQCLDTFLNLIGARLLNKFTKQEKLSNSSKTIFCFPKLKGMSEGRGREPLSYLTVTD